MGVNFVVVKGVILKIQEEFLLKKRENILEVLLEEEAGLIVHNLFLMKKL
jgi:hypothetical protein